MLYCWTNNISQICKSQKLKVKKSNVDRLAEEHERRCGRVTNKSSTPTAQSLIAIYAEQGQRELDFVTSPNSFSNSLRLTKSTQNGSDTNHVEPLVAAKRYNDGA